MISRVLGQFRQQEATIVGGGHSVENSIMVLPATDVAHPRASPDPSDEGFDPGDSPTQLPKHTALACRLAYLRAKFCSGFKTIVHLPGG